MMDDRVADALAATGTGFWSWDRASGHVEWDHGVEALFGLEPDSFEGRFEHWTRRIHPDDLSSVLERLEKAVETGGSVLFDHRTVWPDGSIHWLECRGGILVDEDGEATGAAGVAIDIDYRRLDEEERRTLLESELVARRSLESAWERLAQLHVVAVHLAGAASVREVGWALVNQGTATLGADGGFFSVVDHQSGRLVLQARKGARPDVVEYYSSLPLDTDTPAATVARSGEPIYVTSSEEREERFPGLPDQGAAAFVIYPIAVNGEVAAVLAYGYTERHEFTSEDEELIATVVGMSTQAIQRASLHDATEMAAARSAQLESVIARLAGATTRTEVADIVVDSLIPAVGADKGTLYLVEEASRSLHALAIHGYSDETTEKARVLPLDGANAPADAIRTMAPVYIQGPNEFAGRYPLLNDRFGSAEIAASTIAFPLIVEGKPIGTIGLGFEDRHPLANDERRHLAIVAGICAHALSRALAFEEANTASSRLRSIDQITDAALSRLSLADLFEELPARIAAAIGCDAVRLTLIDESGEYLEVKGSHGIPEDRLARVPVGRGLSGTIAAVGTPRVIEDISTVEVIGPPFPDHVTSEAGVPLRSGGRVIGVLDIGSGPQRPLTQEDIELLEIAADRVATAIERSRAYEVERTERSRSDLISELSEVISQAGPLQAQLEKMAGLFCEALADSCVITVAPEPGETVQGCGHRRVEMKEQVRTAADSFPHDPRGLASGRTRIYAIPNRTALEAIEDRQLRRLSEELDLVSVLTVSLRGVSEAVGRIVLGRTKGRSEFETDELTLMEDLAARMGTAIGSRLTFERHRNTAITLQRSLLPSKLPEIEGLEVSARYWPASESFEVGGDFYDVIELNPNRWGIMVGDVSGKGVEAAAMTGIARHTARAAARHGVEPSGVLRWVHEAFMEQAESTETYCTAVFGLLDRHPKGFVFRFAVGGHPLPILRPKRGATGFVGRPGTVLGLIEPIELSESEILIEEGDSLIIYTDGVTDVPVANAITEEELVQIVEESRDVSAGESIDSLDQVLRTRYRHHQNRDDTAVLVMKCSTPDLGEVRDNLTRPGIGN
jgi:PAS domain S-box-containing protein